MHAKGLIILLVTVTVLTATVFAWYNIQLAQDAPKVEVSHKEKSEGLGAAIYTDASNPVSNVTETNPMKETADNPFDEYKNPFE